MNNYNETLKDQFKDLTIELVNFDNGSTPESMAAYILISGLTKSMLKDKGSTALDLGNYIYRTYGLQYEMCPEYHRSGEAKDTIAFYISKERMERMPHLIDWILKVYNKESAEKTKRYESALYNQGRFVINAK